MGLNFLYIIYGSLRNDRGVALMTTLDYGYIVY